MRFLALLVLLMLRGGMVAYLPAEGKAGGCALSFARSCESGEMAVYLLVVIPGRAKRELGIHRAASNVEKWIPGSRQVARPGMTDREDRILPVFCPTCQIDFAKIEKRQCPQAIGYCAWGCFRDSCCPVTRAASRTFAVV